MDMCGMMLIRQQSLEEPCDEMSFGKNPCIANTQPAPDTVLYKGDKLPVVSRVISCSITPFIRLTTPVTHVPVVPHEAVAEVSRIGNV